MRISWRCTHYWFNATTSHNRQVIICLSPWLNNPADACASKFRVWQVLPFPIVRGAYQTRAIDIKYRHELLKPSLFLLVTPSSNRKTKAQFLSPKPESDRLLIPMRRHPTLPIWLPSDELSDVTRWRNPLLSRCRLIFDYLVPLV
jgi:hypothetical protein